MDSTPLEELSAALRRLHRAAGEPSTHEIARRINYSHTTVAQTLKMKRCYSWPVLESIVKGLGGDIEEFRSYWIRARDAEDPLPGISLPGALTDEVAQLLNNERSDGPHEMPPGAADGRVVLRWKTRLETIEFFDRELALQWIKAHTRKGDQGE
jgi:hypothetical protein